MQLRAVPDVEQRYLLMDQFDNFQDSTSSYGGLPIVDDTSSVVSGFTSDTDRLPDDLSTLSLSDSRQNGAVNGQTGVDQTLSKVVAVDDELDGVLDDLKDESTVELPPHACR